MSAKEKIPVMHEEYREMLAAYALGALEAAEARSLEDHLAGCSECSAEVAEWSKTASALALSTESVEPSPQLRARILESVRSIPQSPTESKASDGAEADGAPKTTSNVIQMPEASRTRWSAAQKFGAIAAALVITALSASLFIVWTRLNSLQQQYEREHTAVEVLAKQVAEEREVRELLTAPGAHMAQLSGTNMAQQASARLAFDPQTGRAMLFAYNLPPAPSGKAYQLWYIADLAHPVPGGVFTTDARGGAVLHDQVPMAGRNASVFAVTLEPQGGVSAPTGDKYLLSPIS
jgi:anti-sigma-K factor RskA